MTEDEIHNKVRPLMFDNMITGYSVSTDTHFHYTKPSPGTIPSVANNHPSFNPDESLYIWRGPTWILFNWFMHQFFLEKGFEIEARKLVESIEKLIDLSGFREYYIPFTRVCCP